MSSSATSVPYTIAVSKGSALVEETRTLLRAWDPKESLADFRRRVVSEDLLGKTTAQRADDVVRRVFARRFLLPDDRPARALKRFVESGRLGAFVSDLCLLYAARHDALLRDVITGVYWRAASAGHLVLGPKDVLAFLRDAEEDGRIPERWSGEVKIRVARGVLRALRDFGLLQEHQRSRREIVVHRIDDRTIVYLAHELHFAGLTDASVVEHEDWTVFGLHRSDVVTAMDRLTAEEWWIVQAAGEVVRIAWEYRSMDEVVDALVR